MKKTVFILLISTMSMLVTIRDGIAQAPDISVSVVMSKSAYDITTIDSGTGQVEPIIMAINIKNNSGVDLVVSSPFRPVVAGGNGGNIHLDLTFTNQDGFAITADEFINQTDIPPPVVINEVPMDRVEIWPAGDEFTITLPNAYAYYPDLLKGEWKVDLLKTLRFYSEFQNINSILYSPIEPDPDTGLPIIDEVTITANNFVTLVADEDGDGYSWPIVMSLPAAADALIVDCDDSPSGADGILGTNDDGANINPGMPEICGNGIDDDCNPATPDSEGGGTLSEEDIALLALIDSSINSSDLKSALNDALPLSDSVLIAAINRNPPMNSSDLKDVLLNQTSASKLTICVLQNILFREPSMNTDDNRVVLIANTALPTSILEHVCDEDTPLELYPDDRDTVVEANGGCP